VLNGTVTRPCRSEPVSEGGPLDSELGLRCRLRPHAPRLNRGSPSQALPPPGPAGPRADKPRSPAGCGARRSARPGRRPGHTMGSAGGAAAAMRRGGAAPCAGGGARAGPRRHASGLPVAGKAKLGTRKARSQPAGSGAGSVLEHASGLRLPHVAFPGDQHCYNRPLSPCPSALMMSASGPTEEATSFWVRFRLCSEAAQLSSVGTAKHTCSLGLVHACTRLGQLVWQARTDASSWLDQTFS
jgi:hypothetical protein